MFIVTHFQYPQHELYCNSDCWRRMDCVDPLDVAISTSWQHESLASQTRKWGDHSYWIIICSYVDIFQACHGQHLYLLFPPTYPPWWHWPLLWPSPSLRFCANAVLSCICMYVSWRCECIFCRVLLSCKCVTFRSVCMYVCIYVNMYVSFRFVCICFAASTHCGQTLQANTDATTNPLWSSVCLHVLSLLALWV